MEHKPWFVEGCSKVSDQKKQAKLEWLQDPSEVNRGDLNNVRHEASRYCKNKNRTYLKHKINELAKNCRTETSETLMLANSCHPDDRGDTYLRNVGCYRSNMVSSQKTIFFIVNTEKT
jgi:hypothetical protein